MVQQSPSVLMQHSITRSFSNPPPAPHSNNQPLQSPSNSHLASRFPQQQRPSYTNLFGGPDQPDTNPPFPRFLDPSFKMTRLDINKGQLPQGLTLPVKAVQINPTLTLTAAPSIQNCLGLISLPSMTTAS